MRGPACAAPAPLLPSASQGRTDSERAEKQPGEGCHEVQGRSSASDPFRAPRPSPPAEPCWGQQSPEQPARQGQRRESRLLRWEKTWNETSKPGEGSLDPHQEPPGELPRPKTKNLVGILQTVFCAILIFIFSNQFL